MRRIWRFPTWVTLAVLLLLAGCSPGYSSTSVQGRAAPDFRLENIEGQSVALSDFRGKPVLVNFWATWCLACREEMPYLQQVYNEWTAKGLVLLTVDIGETPSVITKYFEENNLSMPVLLDIDQEVARRYNITGIPTSLLIDGEGIIRKRQIGAYPNAAAIEKDLSLIMR